MPKKHVNEEIDQITWSDKEQKGIKYLWWQGRARNGMLGLEWHMGHSASSPEEPVDLSLENGRNFLTEDEFKRGRSKSSISCIYIATFNQFKNIRQRILLCKAKQRKPNDFGSYLPSQEAWSEIK